jgi:hypothetical protein
MGYAFPNVVFDIMEKAPATDDGVYLDELEPGAVIELETKNHRYTVEKRSTGETRISGHPTLCPTPLAVQIGGSRSSEQGLRRGFIGRGMHLVFEHPQQGTVSTSGILEIRRIR